MDTKSEKHDHQDTLIKFKLFLKAADGWRHQSKFRLYSLRESIEVPLLKVL